MKKYLLFIILFAFVFSCSNSNASSKDNVAEYLQPSLTNNSFYEQWNRVKVDKNLQHFRKYQTFNEFTMKGEGVQNRTPFVYVKKIKDTITVRSSYELDSARIYIPEYEMEPKPDKDDVYDVVETMPKFPGGYKAVMDYIKEKVEKSDWDSESCALGRVVVSCVVEVDGSISNVKVFRSVEPSRDKVAIQIVKEMPKWIPGKHNGKEVRVRYFIPVSFGH